LGREAVDRRRRSELAACGDRSVGALTDKSSPPRRIGLTCASSSSPLARRSLLLGAFETLAPEYDVVGGVSDGRALLAAAEKLQPDVVVLDVSMPLLNGLDAGREIRRRFPRIKLVFITMNEDADLAAAAFRIGASAYLLKRSAASELQFAIREALNGRSYLTPLVPTASLAPCPGRGRKPRPN
jgi:CheY-like chemotaxis protein